MKPISLIKSQLDWSMLRWFLVGSTTFAIDYIGFLFFYGPISSVFIANFLSGLASISFNYFSHHRWTFKSETEYSKTSIRYILFLIVIWILSTLILKLLISLDLSPRVAKLIPVIIITPFSYFILNHLVFKKTKL